MSPLGTFVKFNPHLVPDVSTPIKTTTHYLLSSRCSTGTGEVKVKKETQRPTRKIETYTGQL